MAEEIYQLVVNEGPEPGHCFRLGLDVIIIGRDQFSDIVFDHSQVSRHHARMTRSGSSYVLQDLGSTNGTFVDDKQLGSEPVLLQAGMSVRLGRAVTLSFQNLSSADPMATIVSSSPVVETIISEPGALPGIEDTVTLVAAQVLDNPYVGPRAFEPDERKFFYGRDDEIAILAGQVMSRRASVFFAQSGAGKSSLLRAGLLPDLTRKSKVGRGPRARAVQKMHVMPILQVGYNPTDEQMKVTDNVYVLGALLSLYPKKPVGELASLTLCEGLASYFDRSDDTPATDDASVSGDADAQAGDAMLSTLLIFDQFEELFTYHPEQWRKREDFFRQVNQALEVYPDLHVVFTMREDFIAELTPFANLLPDQLRARFRLERLKRDAALQAIIAPAERAGRTFAEGVAEELADNLRRGQPKKDRPGGKASAETELGAYVEPVHLQIVCRQLWENLPAKRKVIEAADVQAFGDVDQALTGFYESTLAVVTARTDISQRRLRAWFNEEVITPARTRGLVYRGKDETEGLPNAAADILNDAYIIRADVRGGDVWYQLAHDRLVEPVLEANVVWRENYQNPLDKVTQAWLVAGRDPERLIEGTQLAIAQAYADENPNELLSEEEEFLAESHRQEKLAAELAAREARRRRRTIIAAGVVAAILIAATIFAVIQSQIARENEVLAENKAQEAEEAKKEAEFQAVRAEEEAQRAEASAELAAARAEEAQQAQADAETQRVEAETQRDEAERQTQEADRQRQEADKQRETAEREKRLGLSEGLAANALAEISNEINDPSLALILALESVNITRDADGTVQDNARRALLEAVANTPPWQMNLPRVAHEGPVTRSAFSPDGQRLVSGSWDGMAMVWDLESGDVILNLIGHSGSVNSAVFSPDGEMIATASEDQTARIWDATSGELLYELVEHQGRVDHAAFNNSGDRLVTASGDNNAIVWDTASGEEFAVLEGHSDSVSAANFDPLGERVVTASADGSARVWDAESGQELLVLEGQDDFVIWAVFDDAGERIATASLDGLVRVWDAGSGELLVSAEGSGEPIVSAMFSSDGEKLVAASWDGIAGILDAGSGDLIHTLEGHAGLLNFADFSPDDQRIVTTSDDKTIRLWDTETAEMVDVLGGSGGPAMDASFNSDGSRLAVGSENGIVVIWEVDSGNELLRFKAHDYDFTSLDFSPDDRHIVTTGADDQARVWDAESGALVLTLDGHDGPALDAEYSPDGTSIATVGDDGQLLVWNALTGEIELFRTDASQLGGIEYVAYSNDGRKLATFSHADGQIRTWDANSGQPLFTMSDKLGTESLQFSPDDSSVLASNTDGTVRAFDVFGGGQTYFLNAHPNFVRSAAFSPDGSLLVTASDDTTARVWDVESGEELFTLTGHGNWLTSATFSPDGRLIASTDLNGVTKLWNVGAPALIPELEHDGGSIYLAAFTPDGQRAVTAGNDFTIRVWDVESGEEVQSIDGANLDPKPFDGSNNLAILPVVNDGGSIDLWDVNSGAEVVNLAGHNDWVTMADVSADGQIVVTLGCDEFDDEDFTCAMGLAKVWDGASGDELFSVPYDAINNEEAEAFELSRDGTRLVISNCLEYDEEEDEVCIDRRLTTWDTTSGEEIASWPTGPEQYLRVDFSPDRTTIFTTDGGETQIWDVASGELLQTLPGNFRTTDLIGLCAVTLGDNFTAMIWDIRTGALLGTIAGHRDVINTIEFSPDGERLITSSWDSTARVWNSRTGIEILNLNEHDGQVWRAHFSPDGNYIITSSEDGTALIWPYAVDKLLEMSGPAVQRYSPFLTPAELARFGLAGN